jgi:hypothetical protein
MIKGTLVFGALFVAIFEVLGFQTVRQYLTVLGIPVHLTGMQVFELAVWGQPVFFSASPVLLGCFSILIGLAYIRFVGRATSQRTRKILHHSSGTTVSPAFYVLAHVFGESSSMFDVMIPVAQVVLFGVTAFAYLAFAETVGNRMAVAALTGHVYGTTPQADVRDSAHLIVKRETTLPAGIRDANAHGALALLWLEEKTVYVAPVHAATKLDAGFLSVYGVSRDSITAVKHSRQWQRHHLSAAPPANAAPWWMWVALAVTAGTLAFACVLAYRQQREQIATIAPADGSELRDLQMPIGEAESILDALSNGQDVLVTVREQSGTSRLWLKAAAIEHGLVVHESQAPTTQSLVRRLFARRATSAPPATD